MSYSATPLQDSKWIFRISIFFDSYWAGVVIWSSIVASKEYDMSYGQVQPYFHVGGWLCIEHPCPGDVLV